MNPVFTRRCSSEYFEPRLDWCSCHKAIANVMRLPSFVCAIGILGSGPAIAQTVTFTKIVDTDTPIPGGTGTFTTFGDRSLDQGILAFIGHGLDQSGVYLYVNGELSVVADRSTAIPDGVGNFTHFSPVSLDGLDLAFAGGGDGAAGIYSILGGSLAKVVDLNTAIPDGMGTFDHLDQPSLDDGVIAFVGSGPLNQFGIYLADGGMLTTVADTNTSIPDGTGDFEGISSTPASLDGGQVAFAGHDTANQFGIYVSSAGTLTKVADVNTLVPGGVGTFNSFQQPVINDGVIAFMGLDASLQPGIYLAEGGTLDIAAGTGAVDAGFTVPSLDAGSVAFEAFVNPGPHGVFTNLGGMVSKVIDVGDMLDGKQFDALSTSSFSIVSDSLSGDQVEFRAKFADGSEGIFLATVVSALRGDYNDDDVVDAADYTVWRDQFLFAGFPVEPCSGADGNCNGFIDILDYEVWLENFGRTLGNSANVLGGGLSDPATGIPEPSPLAFAAPAVVAFTGRRLTRLRRAS